MKASSFDYVVAKTVADASAALASDGATTAAIAAGQSLLPLNLRVAPPDLVVDLGRLDELKEVSVSSDRIRIGAFTMHATIEDGLWRSARLRRVASSKPGQSAAGSASATLPPRIPWWRTARWEIVEATFCISPPKLKGMQSK